jgi:hypothetical protein
MRVCALMEAPDEEKYWDMRHDPKHRNESNSCGRPVPFSSKYVTNAILPCLAARCKAVSPRRSCASITRESDDVSKERENVRTLCRWLRPKKCLQGGELIANDGSGGRHIIWRSNLCTR